MPTIRKRPTGWQAMIRLKDHPPESQIFDTKARASAWGHAREAELKNQGKSLVKATLLDAFEKYRAEVCPDLKSGANASKRLLALSKIKDLLPMSKPVVEVTAVDLSKFRDTRLGVVAIATVRKEMTIIRSVLESARRDWGMIMINPIQDVKKPPAPADRKRLFTDTEAKKIIDSLGYVGEVTTLQHQVAVALLLAFETGMRAGELLHLEWHEVYLDQKYVHLDETKNGTERDVPISSKAVDLITKLKSLDKNHVFTITSASLDALFRKARDRHKIKNLHFHDSRANAITLLSKKLDILPLARMIGHKDIKNLMIYYRESATEIADQLG